MENNQPKTTNIPKPTQEHTLTLINRTQLNMTGITKMVSVKPDLVQLKSTSGDIIIAGQNIEVTKLDLDQHELSLTGKFDGIKYTENNKTPLLKKIFK